MNRVRPLLIPSQQWWEGSDGHASSQAAAVAVREDATAVPSLPTASQTRPTTAERPEWDFSAAPLIPMETTFVQPVGDPVLPPAQVTLAEHPAPSSVRRPDAGLIRRAAVAACVLLLVCLAGFGGSKWWAAHAFASARSACDSAELEVRSSRRRLQRAMSSVKSLDMSTSSVADPKTIDELNAAMKNAEKAIPPFSCRASSHSRQTLESEAARADGASRHITEASARVEKAAKAVKASRKEKRLTDAQTGLKDCHATAGRLYTDSEGQVANNATRVALQQAVDRAGRLLKSTDTARIKEATTALQAASDAVRASMDAKNRQNAEAAASQSVQETPVPNAGVPVVPAPQTPVRPQPQRQPVPQPQNPPRGNGWSVPAPTGPDTGLPGHISGL